MSYFRQIMTRYSEDMVMERSPFWHPRRRIPITGSGSASDPYVVPGSPTVMLPAARSYAMNAHLFNEQFKRSLKLGSQSGSIN